MEPILAYLPRLLDATALTIAIFATVSLISTVLGALFALLVPRVGALLAWPLGVYSWFFRGVPELVVLLFCYLALPQAGLDLEPVGAAILGFSLIGLAYEYEIFRGALESIDPRQYEACRALGIPWPAMMRRIIVPQVLRIAIGPWITHATGAVKRISIASAVAVTEIMHVTKQAITGTNRPFEFILIAALIYGGLASLLMIAEEVFSRRADYQRDLRARAQ